MNSLPRALPTAGAAPTLGDREFERIRDWLNGVAGIALNSSKKALVAGRLARRVQALGCRSYDDYLARLLSDRAEHQQALDLLTTNETHFFREPKHFDFLTRTALPALLQRSPQRPVRAWSAACSTGQEVYTLAMVMAEALGDGSWEVLGTDICTRVLARARQGLYDLELAQEIPKPLLHSYCLRGTGSQAGRFQIAPELMRRVRFEGFNLVEPPPGFGGDFDLILLRNVMIYFNEATKRKVVSHLVGKLRPGGWLLVGHSESLNGLDAGLIGRQPSVYQRSAHEPVAA